MAIYTPRGLKIRISIDYAFALIARLHPKVSAFRILKTTEGLESLHEAFAFLVTIAAYLLRLMPWQIGLMVFLTCVVVSLMTRYGFFVIPGIVRIGTIYSYFAGYGLLLIALCAVGWYFVGWQGVLAYFVARIVAGGINQVLDWRETSKYMEEIGHPLTGSERNFINAYRLHALYIGATTDVFVEESERERENWEPALVDLAERYPEVVARFTVD